MKNEKKHENSTNSFSKIVGKVIDNGMKYIRNNFESDDKKQLYQNIADFLKRKFQKDEFTCLTAAYILFSDERDKQLAESAKRILIAVKVNYEQDTETDICTRTTEIFFSNPNDDKVNIEKIEDQIQRNNIDPDVREMLIKKGENKISFKVYP